MVSILSHYTHRLLSGQMGKKKVCKIFDCYLVTFYALILLDDNIIKARYYLN